MDWNFWSQRTSADPRQDTEVLVETALDVCKQEQMGEIRLLDMCTGSGCILLSLLHELKPEQ